MAIYKLGEIRKKIGGKRSGLREEFEVSSYSCDDNAPDEVIVENYKVIEEQFNNPSEPVRTFLGKECIPLHQVPMAIQNKVKALTEK